jgi:hypothetical protein
VNFPVQLPPQTKVVSNNQKCCFTCGLYVQIIFIADYVLELFEDLVFRREMNNSFPKARWNNALGGKDRPLPIAQSTPHSAKHDIV